MTTPRDTQFLAGTMLLTALTALAAPVAAEEAPLGKLNDHITVTALVESHFTSGKDFFQERFSDLTLHKAELGFDLIGGDWTAAHVLFQYEDGGNDDNIEVDEAFITLGNAEQFPLLLTAGKFVLPFGAFETGMITDPLTQELGEINKGAVALGLEAGGLVSAIFGYQGMGEIGATDEVRGFGAMLGYGYESDETTLRFSLGWVNNIADSGTVDDFFDEQGFDAVQDEVSGMIVSLGASFGPWSMTAEYVSALDDYDPAQLAFGPNGARPHAWQTELAYTMAIMERETVFALGYQGTSEAVALGLPETRLLAVASMEVLPHVIAALEYYRDTDYGVGDGGSGEDADVVTVKLAFEL